MFLGERKIKTLAKTIGFVLFILLMSSYFEQDTIIIVLLSLILLKMRK